MSGSAGGNRIPRSAVEKTVQEYIDKVLSKVPGFKSAKVSGSYNTSAKQDFGDIDLITSFEGEDKKEFKKQLAKYLESLPDDIIVPFKSEKYKGKKTMNTGEIVTILYPIAGMPGEFVQVDNIIALSEEEGDFKKTFLDYPAEIQGLILGLVKVVTLEEDPNKVLAKMGIKNIPTLEPNQEYEFNLSSAGLTLRIVTLDQDYKQLDRTEVWKSSNWADVKKLLSDYNIDQSFKDLVTDLKKLKNPRSKNRIKGIFKSMVSIKSGEVNTPKGANKQMALDTVATLEEKYGSFIIDLIRPILEAETGKQTIAVFPGAFKPPHASHLKAIQVIAPKVDKVYVYVSKQPRVKEGQVPIDASQAMAVWELYKQKGLIPDNVEIKLAQNATPVSDAYQEVEAHPENKYLAIFGKNQEDRWKSVEKDREKYGHVTPVNIGNLKGLSATGLRTAIKNKDLQAIETFLPKGITAKEYIQALSKGKKEDLTEAYKGKKTNKGAPGTFKAKITKAYGGDVTIEKARKFKSRENATALDKQQANWFINFHSKNENLNEIGDASAKSYPFTSDIDPSKLVDIAKKFHETNTSTVYFDTKLVYKFKTDKANYDVRFHVVMERKSYANIARNPNWKPGPPYKTYAAVGFNIEGDTEEKTSNLNEQFSVLSTVTKIIFDFIDNVNASGGNLVSLQVAPKSDVDTGSKLDSKRGKFYAAYIKKNLSKLPDYDAKEGKNDKGDEYVEIYKKNSINEVGESNLAPYKWQELDMNGYVVFARFVTDNETQYDINLTTTTYVDDDLNNLKALEVEFIAKPKGAEGSSAYIVVNKGEMYRVMATIVDIVKKYIKKQKAKVIIYSPSKKSDEEDFGTQRDQLYKAFISKAIPGVKFEQDGGMVAAILPDAQINELVTATQVICDNCGWEWKIADGGDDLYVCHNTLPGGSVCGHNNDPDLFEAPKPKAGSAIPYGSGYRAVKENLNEDLYSVGEPADSPVQTTPSYAEVEQELRPYIIELVDFMVKQGLNVTPAPRIEFVEDEENAKVTLGRTAYYDPNNKVITLYITRRHPKDVLRSFAHEMIHHMQNLEGRLENMSGTTNVNEDNYLANIEREAYDNGNMIFRSWENDRVGNNSIHNMKGFTPGSYDMQPITEGAYDSITRQVVKDIMAAWKEEYTGEEGTLSFDEEYETQDAKGRPLDFILSADLLVKETEEGIYKVDGGADADTQKKDDEDDPDFAYLEIRFQIDPRTLPQLWSRIYADLTDVVRHEIEHLTQMGVNVVPAKELPDDKMLRKMIDWEVLPKADYFRLQTELDPMLQGMYLKAKKTRTPFKDILNDYLDMQDVTPEDKENILELWRKRLKALSLPQF